MGHAHDRRPRALIVVDLGFGDSGKGSVTDHLTRVTGARLNVRFNGGPQAAHNVCLADGRHHTFSQFGSGTLAGPVRTHLSRFMLINPLNAFAEAVHLAALTGERDILGRLSVDRRARVITPFQVAAGRLREMARGDGRHGSCGQGIGEVMLDAELGRPLLHADDLADRRRLRHLLARIQEAKLADVEPLMGGRARTAEMEAEWRALTDGAAVSALLDVYGDFADRVGIVDETHLAAELRRGPVIFEGAQGVLIDEWFGFHPHTTWSTTTFANAETLLRDAQIQAPPINIGVLRTYFSRHGSGPFMTEDPRLSERLTEPHNDASGWQGRFRLGSFDAVAARYALSV